MHSNIKPLRLEVDPLSLALVDDAIDWSLMKAHLGLEQWLGNEPDEVALRSLINNYLWSAVTTIEDSTHRSVLARPCKWVLADFPRSGWRHSIRLPRGKTQSVESVQYVQDNILVTLADFEEDLTGDDGGVILPAPGKVWPSVDLDAAAPVQINFTAGYEPEVMPRAITVAALLLTAHYLANREAVVVGSISSELPLGVESLISPYRLARMY